MTSIEAEGSFFVNQIAIYLPNYRRWPLVRVLLHLSFPLSYSPFLRLSCSPCGHPKLLTAVYLCLPPFPLYSEHHLEFQDNSGLFLGLKMTLHCLLLSGCANQDYHPLLGYSASQFE